MNLALCFLLFFRWHIAKPPKLTNCNTGFHFLKLPCPTLASAALKPTVLGKTCRTWKSRALSDEGWLCSNKTTEMKTANYLLKLPTKLYRTRAGNYFLARLLIFKNKLSHLTHNAKLRGGYKRRVKCEACADWRRPVAQPRP